MEAIVPVALFLMLFGVVAVVMYFRFRGRRELQLTIRATVESGQPMSPEVLTALTESLKSERNDLHRGVIFIALGIATVVFAFMIPEQDAQAPLMGLSAFPFFIGVAYLIIARLNANREKAPASRGA